MEYGYASLGVRYTSTLPPVYFAKNVFSGSTGVPATGPNWSTPSGIQSHRALISAESRKSIGASAVRYCQDTLGRYRLDCDASMKLTPYYGFVLVQPVLTRGDAVSEFTVENAFKVTAYFATTEG